MIGVYSDVKIKTVLTGLRSRYDIPNLVVSDSLTAAPTMERHLAALDFAEKVLWVDVVHGLNDLIHFLGGKKEIDNESALISRQCFADYSNYFQNKQSVLSYQDEKLHEYVVLTNRRALDLYGTVVGANNFLIRSGKVLLLLTVIFTVLSAAGVGRLDWKLTSVTGGLSLVQLISAFFSRPVQSLMDDLTSLAKMRMILESHSFKVALARFQLTGPDALKDGKRGDQFEALEKQIALLQTIDKDGFARLKDLNLTGPNVAEAHGGRSSAQ